MSRVQKSFLQLSILLGLSASGIASADCVDRNTCFGTGALEQLVGGLDNSAFGFQALGANVDGHQNTAVGSHALVSNTSGRGNSAVGSYALRFSTTSDSNTAVGYAALAGVLGRGNVGIGTFSLEGLAEDDEGERLFFNGDFNVSIGFLAMSAARSGSHNTAVGTSALSGHEPDGFMSTGDFNTAVGSLAMQGIKTGKYNTATGHFAMQGGGLDTEPLGISGSNNTANGTRALEWIQTGNNNTATGYLAMSGGEIEDIPPAITGSNNTAAGARALHEIRSGNNNTAIGYNALATSRTGNYNTANGNSALFGATTGSRNVALGHRAGAAITTGSHNIIIGSDNRGMAADTGVIRIGVAANQKKTFIAGIRGITTGSSGAVPVLVDGSGQLGTINSSRAVKEDIESMGDVSERLLALRPVTFRYKQADDDGSKPIQFGLIAEEVAESFPELVVYDANGRPETVSYHLLATLLLNEFQKERSVVQAQATRIAELEHEFAGLAEIVGRLNYAAMIATAQ